jgi:hypothetical protein
MELAAVGRPSTRSHRYRYAGFQKLETQVFQFLDTQGGHGRTLSFLLQPVLLPLECDPRTQLGVFAVDARDIAVPVDFQTLHEVNRM